MYRNRRKSEKIHKQYQIGHLSLLIGSNELHIESGAHPYELAFLTDLKRRLNDAKSELDYYYILSKTDSIVKHKWMKFSGIVDIYKGLRFEVEKVYNAKFVTNAWLKYWELYSHYNLIPHDGKFVAFFNAELPGAALCAFHHYMQTMRNICYDWRAASIIPSFENKNAAEALGDVYGFYKHNKDKWLIDLDHPMLNDGDMTKLENILDFANRIGPGSEIDGVNLYSHDAGIDVSTDENGTIGFNKQEEANARIHLGCALAGFLTMRTGAVFIAKQYTFFETFTWNLLLIYSRLFSEFYICKPLTSRSANSEIYLIGKGFLGISKDVKDTLSARLVNFNLNPFVDCIAQQTEQVKNIENFGKIIFEQQASIIRENIALYKKYSGNLQYLQEGLYELKRDQQALWLRLYPVGKLRGKSKLLSN